jgi:hypothetical protein
MLTITVSGSDFFNEETQKFFTSEDVMVELEHSLVSLSKWESTYEKPFLSTKDKTDTMVLDYVRMMVIGSEPSPEIFSELVKKHLVEINDYVEKKMTATWFNEPKKAKSSNEVITAELIYYWMISLGIPFECQYWHLNKLLTLIKVCNYKNMPKDQAPVQTMSIRDRRALNEERKKKLGTKG